MDQAEIPNSQQAQRDFLTQGGKTDDTQTPPTLPTTSGVASSSNYYQPMTTYLGDLVRFLGTCDKQEQKEQQQQQQYQGGLQQYPLQDTTSLPNFPLDSNLGLHRDSPLDATSLNKFSNIPQLDLDTIIKTQQQQSDHASQQPSETGTLSDVLKQIQKEQQMQEMQVGRLDDNSRHVSHVVNAHDTQNNSVQADVASSLDKNFASSHHFRHKSASFQPIVSKQEFHELGMQEYDYTQQDYSNEGDRDVQDIGNAGSQQQELKLQYLNQYKPQDNHNRSIEHGGLDSSWNQERDLELQGGGSGGDEGAQLEGPDNYGMYDSFALHVPGVDAMAQGYFSEDIESLKNQFFSESQRMKEIIYHVRSELSGDQWQKLGDAALAVDGLGFAFSNATNALAQEQLRTHQLQDQLALTWQHVQRLRQEAIDLWNRCKEKEGSEKEQSEVLKDELQTKNREVEQMLQVQERLQKENLSLKRELVRQVEQQSSGFVTAVSERNVLKDRLQQMIQELKHQRTQNRDLERLLSTKGISLPSNRFPSWDPTATTSSNVINALRHQAQILKAQQQQHQQLQQQQFLQRKASSPSSNTNTGTNSNSNTAATTHASTPGAVELGSQDLPQHVQAPEPPEAMDSPSDFRGRNAVQLSNGVGMNEEEDEYSESSEEEEKGGEEKVKGSDVQQGGISGTGGNVQVHVEDDKEMNPNLSPFAMPFVPTDSPPSSNSL